MEHYISLYPTPDDPDEPAEEDPCIQCGKMPQLPESAYPDPLENVYRCQHCREHYDPTESELRSYNSPIYSRIYPNG